MNWRLTRDAIGNPEIEHWDDQERIWGFSLLRLIASDPDSGLIELKPGVYLCGSVINAHALLEDHEDFVRAMEAVIDRDFPVPDNKPEEWPWWVEPQGHEPGE